MLFGKLVRLQPKPAPARFRPTPGPPSLTDPDFSGCPFPLDHDFLPPQSRATERATSKVACGVRAPRHTAHINMMNREPVDRGYLRALLRAGARFGFYIHLLVFFAVNLFLAAVNYLATPNSLWFYWPLLGWTIGLIAHAIAAFAGPQIIERMTQRELEKEQRDSES